MRRIYSENVLVESRYYLENKRKCSKYMYCGVKHRAIFGVLISMDFYQAAKKYRGMINSGKTPQL